MASPGPQKIFGYQKRQLLRELAIRETTVRDIAERYGVSEQRIHQIKRENAAAIEEIRADVENAVAGLWIADKVNRVAEHEGIVEMLRGSGDPKDVSRVQTSLYAVAEELGSLPTRAQVEITKPVQVNHTVNGVNVEDLT